MASFLSSIESVKQTPEFIAGVNGLQVPRTPTLEQRQDGEQGIKPTITKQCYELLTFVVS